MELTLTRRGIQSFDASTLLHGASDGAFYEGGASKNQRHLAIRTLDLSHNNITTFIGGNLLAGLAVLNLSNNSLQTFDVAFLPSSLTSLNLSHNALRGLWGLAAASPKLQELNISFNTITSPNLGELPKFLTTLSCQGNLIDSMCPFVGLQQLHTLDLSSNRVEDPNELPYLKSMRGLRHLELRGNPVMCEPKAVPMLLEALPRLARLDRTPLSQASGNQMFKVHRYRSARAAEDQSTSKSACDTLSNSSATRRATSRNGQDMEVRCLEARVNELLRLLEGSEKSEQQLRYQKKILREQVSACAGVIDSQALELERLGREINELRGEEVSLKEPVAELEQTFVQTHASLVAHRLNQSTGFA